MVEGTVNVANNTAVGKTSVFLAWSGSVSQKMAELLRGNLPMFVRNIDIFMSEDITKGKRWDTEIAKALGSTKFGILCLTPENLTSEWIHFEAGALSKTIDDSARVCPLLLDVKKSDLKEPLASFQATLFNKEEFKKLIKALANVCGDILEDGQYTGLMDGLWPKIEESINTLKVELAEARTKSGKPEDDKLMIDPLLEEVVVRVREQGRLLATLAEQGEAGLGKEIIESVYDIKILQKRMIKIMRKELQGTFFDEEGPVSGLKKVDDVRGLDEWFEHWLKRGKSYERLFSYIEESETIPSSEIKRLREKFLDKNNGDF